MFEVIDEDGKIVLLNDKLKNLIGCPRQSLIEFAVTQLGEVFIIDMSKDMTYLFPFKVSIKWYKGE